jgi:nucleotide-binding universal stress UspA family protein
VRAAPDGRTRATSYGDRNDEERCMSTPDGTPILICYDNSDGARRAIETAGALFPGRTAIVLHVWSPITVIAAAYGGMVTLPAYDDAVMQAAAAKLADEGVARALEAGLHARPAVAECTYEGAAHAILRAAEQHGAGVIVLGARGLSGFRSLILGSVSHGVAQHARLPVLIVPPPVPAETPPGESGDRLPAASSH